EDADVKAQERLIDRFEDQGQGAFVEEYDESDERMVINMGPVHPSTHGVLRLVLELDGENVLRCLPVIGYLHTGMEKECEDQNWRGAVTIVTRMDYLAPLFNEQAYSLAVERLLGIEVPPRGRYIRTLMAELNRLSSHLVWFGTQGLDMGAMSAMFYGFRERELILDFYEMVTGLRMNHGYFIPGGVWQDLPDGWSDVCGRIVDLLPGRIKEYEDLLTENPIFLERTTGVGVLSAEQANGLGATGPIARASGVDWDLRRDIPYDAYPDVEFAVPVSTTGDVYARYRVRVAEMYESVSIVRQLMEKMPDGDFKNMDPKLTPPPRRELNRSMEAVIHHFKLMTQGYAVPPGEVYAAVESPRGELGVYAVSDGGTSPYRVHVRDPSFVNLQSLGPMVVGGLVADLIASIASVDPVMGGVDR
ncbi:MAG TPA: NADH dehydrogenase (quinone) subunit D, partial [Actinomycetota bacterium]|nr:NADH dehydrogenase (quinone) subunit D [Actinomycetota bacterium]